MTRDQQLQVVLRSRVLNLGVGSDLVQSGNSDWPTRQYNLYLICPSVDKECGIGRYTLHAAEAARPYFHNTKVLKTTYQALACAQADKTPGIFLFQHEYALVDFHTDLAESDTTASLISNFTLIQRESENNLVGLVMHSLIRSHETMSRVNQQLFSANFPIFQTTRQGSAEAGINFTELGVPTFGFTKVPPLPDQFTVGAFGFLSPTKDVSSIVELCARTGARIRANYAPNNTGSETEHEASRNRILEQAKKLGASGEITFSFLTDEELVDMIKSVSVVYSPQHDFSHFGTSASVRFPLAVGRGAIVPPVRCFHDVAAGVRFAQFDEAVKIVSDMIANPDEVRGLAEAGLEFARVNEIGVVYRELATRMIRGDVWCGGETDTIRWSRDRAKVVSDLNDHVTWSGQNELGKLRTGRGMHGGFVVIEGDPAWSRRDYHADDFCQWSNAAAPDGDMDRVEACVRQIAGDDIEADRQLRSFLGTSNHYLSVTEFCGLPLYGKALVLLRQFGFDQGSAASVLRALGELRSDDRLAAVLRAADLFGGLMEDHRAAMQPLVWGHAIVRKIDLARYIIYPESLLTLQAPTFLRSAYSAILRRHPDSAGLDNFSRQLWTGASKSEVAFALAGSKEATDRGIELAGSQAEWLAVESEAETLVRFSRASAPYLGRLKSGNLELRDLAYAGHE